MFTCARQPYSAVSPFNEQTHQLKASPRPYLGHVSPCLSGALCNLCRPKFSRSASTARSIPRHSTPPILPPSSPTFPGLHLSPQLYRFPLRLAILPSLSAAKPELCAVPISVGCAVDSSLGWGQNRWTTNNPSSAHLAIAVHIVQTRLSSAPRVQPVVRVSGGVIPCSGFSQPPAPFPLCIRRI